MSRKFNYIHKLKMWQSRKIVKDSYILISNRFKSKNDSNPVQYILREFKSKLKLTTQIKSTSENWETFVLMSFSIKEPK